MATPSPAISNKAPLNIFFESRTAPTKPTEQNKPVTKTLNNNGR